MNEIDDIKRRAGLEVSEGSIYSHNSEDMTNPEVLVKGVGRYSLDTLKQNVINKLVDLAKTAQQADSSMSWEQIEYMINHAAMHEMVKTIVAANKELEERDSEH